jgi:nitroimidazol reductase NimA-like FMN-containing flavoprotein (pyridoxamine 5'-phosphate oxidase superfamily)
MISKLTKQQIEEVLLDNIFGHIGCNDGFNTYVYPINYLYDGKNIICHSPSGSKIQVMRENKRVCLQVDEVKKNMHWKSVMIHGEYQELEDERERYNAMKSFVDRNLHLKVKERIILPVTTAEREQDHLRENSKAVFYRIVIDEKNGRFEDA